MITLCHIKFEDPSYYFNLKPNTIVFMRGLTQAAAFLNKAEAQGIKLYGCIGRKSSKERWISYCATGKRVPHFYYLTLSNGVKILDYYQFDSRGDDVPLKEMELVVNELCKFAPNMGDYGTTNKLITTLLLSFLEQQRVVTKPEFQYYDWYSAAMRGGANWTIPGTYAVECHPDFHQMYSDILSKEKFPCGNPIHVDKYEEHELALYGLNPDAYARLKKDGFPLIPNSDNLDGGMFGADGEWFSLQRMNVITSVDLPILLQNYEIDVPFEELIQETLYWPHSINGSTWFKPLVNKIYNKRKTFKGKPQERLYKKILEVLPGHFEMKTYHGGFWSKDFQPSDSRNIKYYNPKIGMFIAAYGRQRLNKIAHMFPHNKVIGADTDSIHFAGAPEELPQGIKDLFGDEPGQLHLDGYYKDVTHEASKRYYGTDAATGESFRKMAGESKDGKAWYWNDDKREYELLSVNKSSSSQVQRNFTFAGCTTAGE